ncbi:MAG: hypothetical protein IJ509_00235 [Bacilli bacterium]|nr:hypothetical protein [Bacilli bacterium]
MTDNNKEIVSKEYEELVKELKQELPNIVLPSMGMLDDVEVVDINGKDYIMSDEEV